MSVCRSHLIVGFVLFGIAAATGARATSDTLPTRLVAVLEIEDRRTQHEPGDASTLTQAIRSAFAQKGGLRVITSETVEVLMNAAADNCEGSCEVDTGRRLGADLVVSGELYAVGSALRLNLRLHETAAGDLVYGTQAAGVDLKAVELEIAHASKILLIALDRREQQTAQLGPPLHFALIGDGFFSLMLESGPRRFNCPRVVTESVPCDLRGPLPGTARVLISGTDLLRDELRISPAGGSYVLRRRGYTQLTVGLVGTSLSGILITGAVVASSASFHSSSTSQTASGVLALSGVMVGVVSLVVLIQDLIRGNHDLAFIERGG